MCIRDSNYLLRLNINPWEDIVSLFSSSMPLIEEHGYHFMAFDSANLQRRSQFYPFPAQVVPHWRVKSSGVRQSKIYKCPEHSFEREGVMVRRFGSLDNAVGENHFLTRTAIISPLLSKAKHIGYINMTCRLLFTNHAQVQNIWQREEHQMI